MQGFRLAAISDVEKTKLDVNVDGRTNGRTNERTNGRTEIWTPISHPAISRCDKNQWYFENPKIGGDWWRKSPVCK